MAGYLDILRPNVLTQVVRQVVADNDPLLRFMGFEPGGKNEKFFGHGRQGTYFVVDDTRRVAKSRAPATPAARSDLHPMKEVPFVYPRMHDSISLSAEFFHNIGKIDNPTQRDEAGRDMIMRQTEVLRQKAANWRVAQTVGMLRNSLYVHEIGDDWYLNYTSGSSLFRIDSRAVAANSSQLNMTNRAGTSIYGASIIDIPWTSSGANIPEQIAKIDSARAILGVGPIEFAHLNSITWQKLITNDYLTAAAGIANAPYSMYAREVGTRADGSPQHLKVGRFAVLPGIEFLISDLGLELYNRSTDAFEFVKHWADGQVVFMSDPKARLDGFTMQLGSEPIAEYDGGPESVRVGASSWSKKTSNPTATEVYVLDNALAINHDPYSIQNATVYGF